MVLVRSQCMKRRGSQSCWRWRRRRNQSLREGNENEEGSGSAGCDDGRKNSLEPFVGSEVEEWDVVGKRTRMRTKKGENEDDPEGNGVEGGQGG